MNNEMTPNLLALLSPEQQEAWERCQKAVPGPWETAEESIDRVIRVVHTPGCKCDEVEDLGHHCGAGHVVMRVHDKSAFFNNRPHDEANLSFIAHARLDLPSALLELAQAEQALADAKFRLLDAQVARTIWMERSKANAAEYNAAYDAMCEIGEMLGCAEDWAAIKAALKETLGKVAEVVTLRAQLAEVTGEQDRLRAALVEIYATATRTLADPPCADMAALIMICTIFEALSAPPEPKPEGRR